MVRATALVCAIGIDWLSTSSAATSRRRSSQETLRVVRVNNRTPSLASSAVIFALYAGWEILSWAAARVKLCFVATVRNATRSSMLSFAIYNFSQ